MKKTSFQCLFRIASEATSIHETQQEESRNKKNKVFRIEKCWRKSHIGTSTSPFSCFVHCEREINSALVVVLLATWDLISRTVVTETTFLLIERYWISFNYDDDWIGDSRSRLHQHTHDTLRIEASALNEPPCMRLDVQWVMRYSYTVSYPTRTGVSNVSVAGARKKCLIKIKMNCMLWLIKKSLAGNHNITQHKIVKLL